MRLVLGDDRPIPRRTMLGILVTLGAVSLTGGWRRAVPIPITVYKDPSCGCCTKWVAHLASNGFAPVTHDRSDMDDLKNTMGIPVALRSCHTAIVGSMLLEGHVPASDIKRAITISHRQVLGLAVPGMPAGSPGMEGAGRRDPYTVIAFSTAGVTSVFATHS
ncbi:MAG TPA: DUF411 domain-containing protein [Gemmatimonadaceae bacterium]